MTVNLSSPELEAVEVIVGPRGPAGPAGGVVTWATGSEPSLAGVPDGTLWIEYTP